MGVLPSSPLQVSRLVDADLVSMDYALVGQQCGPGYLLHQVLFCKRRSITTNATLNVVLAKYPERHGESGEGSGVWVLLVGEGASSLQVSNSKLSLAFGPEIEVEMEMGGATRARAG